MRFHATAALSIIMFSTGGALAQRSTLPADETSQIDIAVKAAVESSGVPSAIVGIHRGGVLVYDKALGNAIVEERVPPPRGGAMRPATLRTAVPADVTMAYPIGSISKQFTAACILLLQERGKLQLDDPVARWLPEFAHSKEVTVRNLLTHTSGYSDYAPQDYTIPAWTKPVDSYTLIRQWATKPLDFEPGTKWQYSNTNFQMAALIIEKASGQKYHDFLWANVIRPLKLQDVLDLDADRNKLQPHGYERHALSPLRPAILEAPGWYTGDGGLAMPVSVLLQWDESILQRKLLKPESYDAMETDFKLKDGTSSHYGLGVFLANLGGKRVMYHSGEVGGFVSNNVVYLDDDLAFAALTNFEGPGAGPITNAIRRVLIPAVATPTPKAAPEKTSVPAAPIYSTAPAEQAKAILVGMQTARIDRSLFTADTNFYFSNDTLYDFANSLAPLGSILSVMQTSEAFRGGMTFRTYEIKFATRTLSLNTYTQKDGKLEQFLINGE